MCTHGVGCGGGRVEGGGGGGGMNFVVGSTAAVEGGGSVNFVVGSAAAICLQQVAAIGLLSPLSAHSGGGTGPCPAHLLVGPAAAVGLLPAAVSSRMLLQVLFYMLFLCMLFVRWSIEVQVLYK